jgi:hypothetical protein
VLTAATGASAIAMQPGVLAAPGMPAASAALPAIQRSNRHAHEAMCRKRPRPPTRALTTLASYPGGSDRAGPALGASCNSPQVRRAGSDPPRKICHPEQQRAGRIREHRGESGSAIGGIRCARHRPAGAAGAPCFHLSIGRMHAALGSGVIAVVSGKDCCVSLDHLP